MEIETDESIIQLCLREIETRLGWGSSDEWSTQDFESLSKKIQESTGVALSVATLKRIWGKIKYDSKPTVTTLNALAQFVGYENWRTFKYDRTTNGRSNGSEGIKKTAVNKKKKIGLPVALMSIAIILSIALVYFFATDDETPAIEGLQFEFSSKKVIDAGVPNTVIFDYDASAASAKDSVFIQQSWDKRLSTLVDKDGKQHTSIYYYPGFFAAKLRINEIVVKEHNLMITTKGWLPLIEQKPVPLYFKESDAQHEGIFGLSANQIQDNNIDLQPTAPRVGYFNVRDFGGVATDDLVFDAEIKNDYPDGTNACQFSEVHLLFEGGALIVPLSAKGCVSELQFMNMDGKKSDLSALGCDFSNWVKIGIEFKADTLKVGTMDNLLSIPLKTDPIKLVGLAFKFQGTGSINNVTVRNHSGKVFYTDDFD